jgi:putative NADPH-quinone reductase
MKKSIVLIQGHPDPAGNRFGHALAAEYAAGARAAGHDVTVIDVARLNFPWLRTKEDFERGRPPEAIQSAQEEIGRAEHIVVFFPLWLGAMPALLKGFWEQLFRPEFVTGQPDLGPSRRRRLKGKSGRIVVTMGMPAPIYRWYFGAHSVKSLERNILGFCGIGPIKQNLIGMVEAKDGRARQKWLARMNALGRIAA